MKTSDVAAKDDRAEAVPLRLVQKPSPVGQLVGELREHRLDRRRESSSAVGAGSDAGCGVVMDLIFLTI